MNILRNKKVIIIIVIIIIIAFYLNSKFKKNLEITRNQTIPTVESFTINQRDIVYPLNYPARISGYREVEVKSQIDGILLKRLYKEGSFVNKGDELFQIDPKSFIENKQKAYSTLNQSKSNLWQVNRNYERIEKLYNKKAVSLQDKDLAFVNLEQAKESVKQAEAELNIAMINLGYTKITAPISGVVSTENFSEGNLIINNNILTKIVQTDPIYINFAYSDSDFNDINKLIKSDRLNIPSDKKISVSIKNSDGEILSNKGFIDFTDSVIDSETSSVNARAEMDNKNSNLVPGQFVKISINDMIIKDCILIPEKSVMRTSNGNLVYVIDINNKVEIRPVNLSNIIDKNYIIDSGLNSGEKIITEGMIKLRPGQEVKPRG